MAETSQAAKYVSEAVGTFVLVFTVGCNILATEVYKQPPSFNVLSIAASLMVMIYALGPISGGHFNPAVTLAVAVVDKAFGWSQAAIYMLSQLVGGTLGACAYAAMFGHVFPMSIGTGFHWWDVMSCELHYTFMLVFVVLNVALAKRSSGNEYFGIAIAFVVVAGGYGAGKVSGAAFNPAVAFAVDLISAGSGFGLCFFYWLAQFLGALLAVGMYYLCRPEEFGGSEEISTTSKLVSEFLGTYMLVFTVGMNVAHGQPRAAAVFAIAMSLMSMIYALGNVSGGHFNPAVTIAVLCSGRGQIDAKDAGFYIITQYFGGIAAGLMYGWSVGGVPIHMAPDWLKVFISESIFTFVLCYTVLSVATTKTALKHFFALAIGFCVVVGGYSCGSISGGHLNPAVSMGLEVSGAAYKHGGTFWACLVYSVFQMCGGVLAAGLFTLTHAAHEFDKSKKFDTLEYGTA